MSLFKKILSSVGIGSATVDLIVENPQISPGQLLQGVVQVIGGESEQHINKIELKLCCNYFVEETFTQTDDDGESTQHTRIVEHTATLASLKLTDSFDVGARQTLSFDVAFAIPTNTPLSLGRCEVWVDTDLDIDFAIDKADRDFLTIAATPRQQAVLTAMADLGFNLVEVECEHSKLLGCNFVQEFEFVPQRGYFLERVSEVEMLMLPGTHQLKLLIEIDRKSRGISGFFAQMIGTVEQNLWIEVADDQPSHVSAILTKAIEEHCK